jgi:hypothetical protein
MRIPRRLLPLLLLISACVAPVVAQSSPDKTPSSSQPQLHGLVAPPEFRAHALPQPPHVLPLPPNALDPQDYRYRIIERARVRDVEPQLLFDPALAQDDTDCYFIRSYRVKRDDPHSDATRPAGYSKCQPAARFQVRAAVDSREIETR